MKEVDIWCDGSSISQITDKSKFHGGAGCVLIYNGKEKHISVPIEDGTNNIAELCAPYLGLKALKEPCKVKIMTDSAYTLNCITKWVDGWVRRGWKTGKNEPVKNKEYIQQLYEECKRHKVEWVKVKAHCGIHFNEIADELACKASKLLKDKEEASL